MGQDGRGRELDPQPGHLGRGQPARLGQAERVEGKDQGRRPGPCALPCSLARSHHLSHADRCDPQPPTIQHALDTWAASSNVGKLDERKEFVKTHMSSIDNGVSALLSPQTSGSADSSRSLP